MTDDTGDRPKRRRRPCDWVERVTPAGWFVRCACGFSDSGRTRNALGRKSAINGAWNRHQRQLAQQDERNDQ